MALASGVVDSFKAELFRAIHDFGSDTIKMALYQSSASLGPTTTAYTATGEASGTGYSAGGATLSTPTITSSGGISWVDFDNPSWSGASFTARGAMIYNSTKANRAVMILDFGFDRAFTSGSNTVTLPANDYNTALIRIGSPR